jgi:hypothetical protein
MELKAAGFKGKYLAGVWPALDAGLGCLRACQGFHLPPRPVRRALTPPPCPASLHVAPPCPPEYLAVGEAPDEIRNVCRQRSRWTKGHMQARGRGRRRRARRGAARAGGLVWGGDPRRGAASRGSLRLLAPAGIRPAASTPLRPRPQIFFSRRCPLFNGRLPLIHKWLYTNGTWCGPLSLSRAQGAVYPTRTQFLARQCARRALNTKRPTPQPCALHTTPLFSPSPQ